MFHRLSIQVETTLPGRAALEQEKPPGAAHPLLSHYTLSSRSQWVKGKKKKSKPFVDTNVAIDNVKIKGEELQQKLSWGDSNQQKY